MNPTILISNDDGISSNGIKAMVEIAKGFGNVVVVAPDKPQSAKSHAISLNDYISYKKMDTFGEDVEAYACSGTPADCVKLALSKILDKKPDLVLSGINHGSNSSVNLIYSGTVAVAVEGAIHDIPSIAFSLDTHDEKADLEATKLYSKQIIEKVLNSEYKNTPCLNVNVPNIPLDKIKGVKVCRQTKGAWFEEFETVQACSKGAPLFLLTGKYINFEAEKKDTDVWAIENNYVAVVPVKVDLTDYDIIENLEF